MQYFVKYQKSPTGPFDQLGILIDIVSVSSTEFCGIIIKPNHKLCSIPISRIWIDDSNNLMDLNEFKN